MLVPTPSLKGPSRAIEARIVSIASAWRHQPETDPPPAEAGGFPMTMKWWGWGEEGRTFALPDPERFWGLVASRLGEPGVSPRIESLDAVTLPPSRPAGEALAALRRAVGAD